MAVLLECNHSCPGAALRFSFGNAAMLAALWFCGLSRTGRQRRWLCSLTIVVAQAVMIVASMQLCESRRRKAIGWSCSYRLSRCPFAVDRHRRSNIGGCFRWQALDGIGAGLQSVAVPGLVPAF